MNYRYNMNFVGFLAALNETGIETKSARGFWGGVAKKGDVVVTSWLPDYAKDEPFKRFIWMPFDNRGGLKRVWEAGTMQPGAKVKLILVQNKAKPGEKGSVRGAAVQPGYWQVTELFKREDRKLAWVVPVEEDTR